MNVRIERTGETKKLRFSGSVLALLAKLKLNPEAVLVARKGMILTAEDKVSTGDDITVLSVISGG